MSLRSCLFTRCVYDTNGNTMGTIRVEFIPKLHRPTQEYQNTPFKQPRKVAKQPVISISTDSSSSSNGSDTEEL